MWQFSSVAAVISAIAAEAFLGESDVPAILPAAIASDISSARRMRLPVCSTFILFRKDRSRA